MPTLAWTMPDEDLSHIAPDVIGHFTGQGLRTPIRGHLF